MAQLSVPSSDLFLDGTSFIATPVGAPTFWEALAEDDLESYSNQHLGPVSEPGFSPSSSLVVGLQPIFDPGVDTGFTLRYIARLNPGAAESPALAFILLQADFSGSQTTITGDTLLWTTLTPDFTLYELPLEIEQVQLIRALNAWGQLYVQMQASTGNTEVGAAPNSDFDFAFIQLEAPSGSATEIEIVGDAGLSFSGYGLHDIEIVDSPFGLDFDPTTPFIALDPEIIIIDPDSTEFGLDFDLSAGAIVTNQIIWISDAGLLFDPSMQQSVLSKDPSGLYTFVSGQHFDRILSRNITTDESQDVKIPDPQGKSGYFGG